MVLAPGDADVLADSGLFAVSMGRSEEGLAAARHAVALVVAGRTTVAEAMRISNQTED